MAVPALHSRIGDIVGERYKLLSVLGQGGMGVLYAAEHLMTKRRVALKVVRVDPETSPSRQAEASARFLAEARHAAAVSHPNIVDVLDMGIDAAGAPYLAMELLIGTSLDHLLAERKRLAVDEALALLIPVLGALATLHDAGIVHRDVKSSNIFVQSTPRGGLEAKLVDFGLAHSTDEARLTRSGFAVGTPLYMAPEQAAGAPAGPGADIWSLGVVLYECLAGTLPFAGKDRNVLAVQVLAGHVRSLWQLAPDLPVPVCHAVERALRVDLGLRYASARDFAHGLVIAARTANVPLPVDPDPVGLSDYERWRSGDDQTPSTRSLAVLPTQPNADAPPSLPASTPAKPNPATTGVRPARAVRVRTWLLALVVGLAGAYWALRKDVSTPREPSAAGSPSVAPKTEQHTPPQSTQTTPAASAPAITSAPLDERPPVAAVPDSSVTTGSNSAKSSTSAAARRATRPARIPPGTETKGASRASEPATTAKPTPATTPAPPTREQVLQMESDWR